MRVQELVRWDALGIGDAERFVRSLLEKESHKKVDGKQVDKLFEIKGISLKTIDDKEYYIYYNYHPSSSYKSVLYLNDNGEIDVKVVSPEGGVMCAFFSEVIVFTLTDRY